MARVERTRNAGTLTEAGFKAMIIAALRDRSRFWKPRQACIKKARVRKGYYLCESCNNVVPATKWTEYKTGKRKGKPKKVKNIVADHTHPVVDPTVGFVDWNTYIERMFIEEGFQAICHDCHSAKSLEETAIRKERNKK